MLDSYSLYRLSIPALLCLVVFVNHYTRDTIAALEVQIETDLNLSSNDYSSLNSLFFLPNIIAPLLLGYLCTVIGRPSYVYIITVVISFIGYLLFAIGSSVDSISLLYCGRLLAGIVYELQDCIPVVILQPLFKEQWGVLCGIVNAVLRMGSVLSFFLNPIFYQYYGVIWALWISAFVSFIGIAAVVGGHFAEVKVQSLNRGSVVSHVVPNKSTYSPVESVDQDQIEMTEQSVSNVSSSSDNTNSNNSNVFDNQIFTNSYSMSCVSILLKYYPFDKYTTVFYWYLISTIFVYGAMVPFWFYGSKFLQVNYAMNVMEADLYMQLPEGMMVAVSPLLGYYLDTTKPSTTAKLYCVVVSSVALALFYISLLYGFSPHANSQLSDTAASVDIIIHPLISMIGIGLSYAFTNCLIWNCVVYIIPSEHMQSCSGLMGGGLNILPSLIPIVMAKISGNYDSPGNSREQAAMYSRQGMSVLIVCSLIAGVFAVLSARSVPNLSSNIVTTSGSTHKRDVNIRYEPVHNPLTDTVAADDETEGDYI